MRVARVEHTQPRGEVIEIDVVLTVKPPLTRLERQRFLPGIHRDPGSEIRSGDDAPDLRGDA